ncbi:P-loop NTPase fold protein [Herbidospora daliensis]|uniref:P-loop NTPase fold protein n=1 Tax=Herbidospora daliensis TaxID=295585 RepID=UPI000A0188E9|nr:P-loop NTPase fold protein [Herbidospora daliensis]
MTNRHFAIRHDGGWTHLIHPGAAICAGIATDDDSYIINSAHGQLVRRRLSDFGVMTRLNGHRMTVADVTVLSPALAASCSADGTTRLWDLVTGAQRTVLRHDTQAIIVRRVSSTTGVSVLTDGSVCYWNGESGDVEWQRAISQGRPMAAAVDDRAGKLYLIDDTGAVWQVDIGDGSSVAVVPAGPSGAQFTSCFALGGPENEYLTFCMVEDTSATQCLISTTGEAIATVILGSTPARCAVWTGTDQLAIGLDDGRVAVYLCNEEGFQLVTERATHRDIVWTIDYTAELHCLVTGSSDGTVSRLSASDLSSKAVLGGLTRGVWTTSWHPDGERLLSAAGDGTVALWSTRTNERLAHSQLAGGWIRNVSWWNDEVAVAVAQKGVLYVVGLDLQPITERSLGVTGNIWSADLDRKAGRVAYGTDRGEVGIADLTSDTNVVIRLRDRLVSAVAWRADGSLVLGTASGEGFEVTRTPNGDLETRVITAFQDHDEITSLLEIPKVGVVVGFSSGLLAILRDGSTELDKIGHHEGPVQSLALTDSYVLSSGADGNIDCRDPESGRLVHQHSVQVSTAGLSVAGNRVSCGSGGVWVFDLLTSSTSAGRESISLWDPPIGLVDAPVSTDTIGRSSLVDELVFLCSRTATELERQLESSEVEERGFLVHIGGEWGAGKTSTAQMLVDQLTADDHIDQWVSGTFNAWQRGQSMPLVDLLNVLERSSSDARPWFLRRRDALRRFWVTRPGLWRALASSLIFFGALYFGLRIFLEVLVIKPAGATKGAILLDADNLSDFIAVAGALLALASYFTGRARPAFRSVHLPDLEPEMNRISKYERAVLRRLPRRVMVVIDELDRCDPARVLEVLRACNKLLSRPHGWRIRNRSVIAFILLAERNWLYNAIETCYGPQEGNWHSRTKQLGASFMEKIALLSFDLPPLSHRARGALVASATGENYTPALVDPPTQNTTSSVFRVSGTVPVAVDVTTIAKSGNTAARSMAARSGLLMPVLSSTDDPRNLELVARAVEIERRMRIERRYLSQYAGLIGANPREIKRVLIRYWLDRVVALSEARDVSMFVETILFESIVTVRWPNLSPAVRSRQVGSLESLLQELGVSSTEEDLTVLIGALNSGWRMEEQRRNGTFAIPLLTPRPAN